MYYTFVNYDNTLGLQLPPILPNRDRIYLPKSATFTNNHGLSNMILQQPNMKKSHSSYYYNHISTSTSSSSISSTLSSNSIEDLVATPTTTNDNMISSKFNLWFDPTQQNYYYPTANLFKH